MGIKKGNDPQFVVSLSRGMSRKSDLLGDLKLIANFQFSMTFTLTGERGTPIEPLMPLLTFFDTLEDSNKNFESATEHSKLAANKMHKHKVRKRPKL